MTHKKSVGPKQNSDYSTVVNTLAVKRRSDEKSTSSHGRAFQILPTLWLQ